MTIQTQFTEEDWARIRRDWSAWWAGELDRPLVMIEQLDRTRSWDDGLPPPYRLPLDWPADRVLDFYEERLPYVRYYGDAWPKWWPNYGPGIAAGFLGCHVRPADDTVWFEPAKGKPDSLEQVARQLRFDEKNPWWVRIRDITRRAVERWGTAVSVAHTDIGGNMDILSSFRTAEQLLFDVTEQPEQVDRCLTQITQCWLRYYDELDAIIGPAGRGTTPWAPIWSAQRTYMLQSDFAYMISPAMFERFVLPDLTACCEHLDHGFYHLDGKGQLPHLDMLLSIPRLRGIQWISGSGQPSASDWPDVLGRIRKAGKLCQVFVTPQEAMKIVKDHGGKGFALAVGAGDMTPSEIASFFQALSKADKHQAGWRIPTGPAGQG
jgi:5-methyltetrahydrofolate--homocysteine methyltransferase